MLLIRATLTRRIERLIAIAAFYQRYTGGRYVR
jgi:hypothetical protein